MTNQPQPGQPTWIAGMNDYLAMAHHADGTLRGIRPVLNVLDFGAVGDGTADDTAALQQAIDAAAGGSTLFIPTGVYATRKLLLPSNITICGDGYGSILKLHDGTLDALFTNVDWANGNHHITLRDLRLEGNRTNNDQQGKSPFPHSSADQDKSHGINFRYVEDSVLENLTVADFYYDGVYWGTSDPSRYPEGEEDRSSGSNRNVLRNCRIIGNGRNGISITRGTDNVVVNNFFQENNIGLKEADPAPFKAGAVTIEPNEGWDDVSRNLVQGNHLLNNHFNGIQVLKNWTSSGVLLIGNTIAGTERHGIAAGLISGLVVQGNHVSGSGGAGMALGLGTGIKDSLISGNLVERNGTGITINGAKGERIVVSGNVVMRNGADGTQTSGIVWVDAREVTLIGNVTLDNGPKASAQMVANGAEPIYSGNRVGGLGISAASRVVRNTDFFATYWRMYGSDTQLYVENQRTGKVYTLSFEPVP